MALTPPSPLRRLFWYFSPAQSPVLVQATPTTVAAEYYPTTRISTAGHIIWALLWIGAVAAYSVLVTYQHFTLPDAQSFSHEPAQDHPMPVVTVAAYCSSAGQCGTIHVTADYSAAPTWCQSGGPPVRNSWPGWYGLNGSTLSLPLCYTGETVFSTYTDAPMPSKLGVIVDFSAVWNGAQPVAPPASGAPPATPAPYSYPYPPVAAAAAGSAEAAYPPSSPAGSGSYGVVRITSEQGGLDKYVAVDSWQVKTVVLGQRLTNNNGALQTTEVYTIAVQYEGRRPTLRATVVVSLAAFADVTRIKTKRGDVTFVGWMGLLGTMCGMAFMMNSIQNFLDPIFVRLFPGPAELDRREKARSDRPPGETPLLASEMSDKEAGPLPPDRGADDGRPATGVSTGAISGGSSTPDESSVQHSSPRLLAERDAEIL